MWVLKFKNWHKHCLIRPLCLKYQVLDLVYLLNSWTKKEKFYYAELHLLQGSSENKKKFIQALRKQESFKKFEVSGDHIMTLNEKPLNEEYYSAIFDPQLIYVKPVAQRTDGFEDWEVASWDKELLTKLLHLPGFEAKLISIENKKLGELFIPRFYPLFSPKQKEALDLAVKEGYYHYPRKIDLDQLAKIAKVKRQTYNENLRRAENKLIPFLTENS